MEEQATVNRPASNEILHYGKGVTESTVDEVKGRGPKKVPTRLDFDSSKPGAIKKAMDASDKVGSDHETHLDTKVNFITENR